MPTYLLPAAYFYLFTGLLTYIHTTALLVFGNVGDFLPSLSVTLHPSPFLSVPLRHPPSLSVSLHHPLSLSVTLRPSPSPYVLFCHPLSPPSLFLLTSRISILRQRRAYE